jgi:hypothetical protein
MTERSPEASAKRFADLSALQRQLEEIASRVNWSDTKANDRLRSVQEPTLVIRGK